MGTWGEVLRCDNSPMIVERNVPLQPLNSFGIAARAATLVRVRSEDDVRAVLTDAPAELRPAPLCPVLELGLVGQTMHQFDERVPVAELEALTRVYRRVIESFLAA